MERKPIYTAMQFPPDKREAEGPITFLSNIGGAIGYLQGELEWRLFDFCRIHQIVYKEIDGIEAELDKIEVEPFSDDIDDISNLATARKMNSIIGKTHENDRIVSFVDHMTVVGLWAIAEQFLGKIYRAYFSKANNVDEDSIVAPYRWDDFVREYNNLGLDLTTCMNYDNANECRVLNNTIKHANKVNSRLASFSYFSSFTGQDLERFPIEMQRYLNGVSDFLGSLIEMGNRRLE